LWVSYFCGFSKFDEFVSFENPKARWKAKQWWQQRHNTPTPETVDEALQLQSQLRPVRRVKVWTNKPRPEILGVEF
jgi:hypothetical protein